MNRKLKQIFFLTFLMFVMIGALHAQMPLRINVQLLKPYPNKISDFQSNPNGVLITITNMSQSPYEVQLLGAITGDNNVRVYTPMNYRSKRAITVAPLAITTLSAADIADLFNVNSLVFAGTTREEALRMNGLPEGYYQVCLKAVDFVQRSPLSEDEPFGCSNVFLVSNLEPPVIIKPFSEEELTVQTPQNIIFNWSLPPGAPPSLQYEVRLVEVPEGRNAFDVMRSSRQSFYERTVTGAPTMLYGPADPPLVPGRRYAMMVTAIDPFNSLVFRNGGRSEVIAFTYGPAASSSGATTTGDTAESPRGDIPTSVITGRIDWFFKASEEKGLSLAVAATPKFIASSAYANALLDPSLSSSVSPTITQAASGNLSSAALKSVQSKIATPKQPVVSSPFKSKAATSLIAVSGAGTTKSISSPIASASSIINVIAEAGNSPHPLQRAKINVYAVSPAGSRTLVGTAVTGSNGEFSIPFVNPEFYNPALGHRISVTAEHPDFRLQENSLSIPRPDETGKFDLGTLKAIARTFRFTPKVLNENNEEVSSAVVNVYREMTYYELEPNHKSEGRGSAAETEVVNGRTCVKVGSVKSGQSLSQLFYSDDWTDQYQIKIVHTELNPLVTSLKVVAKGSASDQVLTVEKEYKTYLKHPSLRGRVSKKLEPIIYVAGATVTLLIKEGVTYTSKSFNSLESIAKTSYASQLMAKTPSPQSSTPTVSTAISRKNIIGPLSQARGSATATFIGAESVSSGAAKVLSENISTTTDSAGYFSFSNLPISEKFLKISVRIPGSDKVYYDSILVNVRGKDYEKDLVITMTKFTLGGVVKDEEGKSIARPMLQWASGGSGFEGDDEGRFVATNTAGNDTLIVKKLGFETKRIPVSLKEPPAKTGGKKSGSSSSSSLTSEAWMTSVQKLPSLSSTVTKPFSAAGLGFITPVRESATTKTTDRKAATSVTPLNPLLGSLYSASFAEDELPLEPVDLGVITLRKKIGRVNVIVKREDGTNVSGAAVAVIDTPVKGTTNSTGEWYSEVPGGEITVEVNGAPDAGLVTERRQVLTSDTEITKVEVILKKGVIVKGTVKSGSSNIEGARVRVDGKGYLFAESNSSGQYSLVIPKGDYTLKATKSGYVGAEKQQLFSAETTTVDFTLGNAGFDISKILGYEVEIESMSGSGNTRTLSGALINLPSNPVFKPKAGAKLTFSDLTVDIVSNVPVPRNGEIILAQTSIDVLAFGYLPVKVKNADKPLTIKQVLGNTDAGQLSGFAEIDYGKYIPIPLGMVFGDDVKHTISSKDVTSGELIVFQTGSLAAGAANLVLRFTKPEVELYGFKAVLDPAACSVKEDGLHLGGELQLSGVPLLDKSNFPIEEIHLGSDGSIKRVAISLEVNKAIDLSVWKATLLSVHINENGLKLSGNTKVTIPQSAEASIGFDNLGVSKTSIFGGNFSFPDEGIDLFKIVKMKTGKKPISFGKVGNSSVYYIGGSGEFKLPSFIDKTLTVDFFQIQTDGNFAATVAANFNVSFFGLADLTIRSLGFRTIGAPGIDVKGDFNLNAIPFIKASAGGIHYESNGTVSVEELGLGFDLVGIAKMSARAKFLEYPEKKGFEGEGHVKIASTPLDIGLGFKYYKVTGGIEVGGLIRAGITIPIGAVTLSEVEGEFSLNTASKKWMGRIGGSLSIGGLNAAVAVKPLSITVENGPVFKLKGGLSVIGQTIAKAEGILDFPKSYFCVNFTQDLNFLPQLITASGGGIMVVSTAKDNTYWMMGVRYEASMLGNLVKGNANITAGWGLAIDAHPEHADYTSFIDRTYADNGVLKGIHVATAAGINFDTGERSFADVAAGRAWYKNFGAVNMDMGFGRGRYGFRVAAGWEAGAYLKIADMDVAGLEAGIEGELKGFYDYGAGYLSFDGLLRAKLIAWIGGCTSACETKLCWGGCFNACVLGCEVCPIPVGGKLCLRPGVQASYNTNDGFSMGIDF